MLCHCLLLSHSCNSIIIDSGDHMLLEYLVSWLELIGCYHGDTV